MFVEYVWVCLQSLCVVTAGNVWQNVSVTADIYKNVSVTADVYGVNMKVSLKVWGELWECQGSARMSV